MKIAVLTGAGMSAESGLKTFRDSNGLWEGYDVTEVASPEGFAKNPSLVLDFYNQRRKQLLQVHPNDAHIALAEMERRHEVVIITQNVDDLHERAGSSKVIHLHGELLKVRSTGPKESIQTWTVDLKPGDVCENGFQLRPHIVWFGEEVPLINAAIEVVQASEVILIVGTSMQVYPAAGLLQYASVTSKIFFIDPNPSVSRLEGIHVFAEKATTGVPKAIAQINSIR